MVTAFFIVGMLTCLGCGWNVMMVSSRWQADLVWTLGGMLGAAMMAIAIWGAA